MIGFIEKVFSLFNGKRHKNKTVLPKIKKGGITQKDGTLESKRMEDSASLFYYYFDQDMDEDEPEDNFIFI